MNFLMGYLEKEVGCFLCYIFYNVGFFSGDLGLFSVIFDWVGKFGEFWGVIFYFV